MYLSKYTIIIDDYPDKDNSLIYHTRTQSLIKVNKDLSDNLLNLPEGFSRINKDYKDTLYDMGIIVKDEKEDQKKLEDFFDQITNNAKDIPFQATILTTYNCNFKCSYCFEANVNKQGEDLTAEVADDILGWLHDWVYQRGYREVYFVFYGGEPLMNVEVIKYMSSCMKQWCENHEIKFGFGMITNGSLIAPELIDELNDLGLQEIQITLDGTKKFHDEKRPFKNGKGSFDLIVDNIIKVIDKVDIKLSGNFDKENLQDMSNLLKDLDARGILHKFSKILFSPIVPRLGDKDNPSSIELKECLKFFDEGLFDSVLYIKKELLKYGIDPGRSIAITTCPLLSEDIGVIIDPMGDIYKCTSFIGYKEYSLGNVVFAGYNEKIKELLEIKAWEQCDDKCKYIPICAGGCRYFSFLEKGDFTSLSCKKDYLDRMIPELVKLDYEREKINI